MNEVLQYLSDREAEFDRHLSIARMLESRVNDTISDEESRVEVRHINTLKSGLLIHLYNIVEAVTTRTLEAVGNAIAGEKPNRWTENVLTEWVRSEVWSGEDRIGQGALNNLTRVSGSLASGTLLERFAIKGEPGSWNDKAIKKVADRLGCELQLSAEIRRAAYEAVYRNDSTALTYLASRRNAIAHGVSTFEDGANDLTLDDLAGLAQRVLPFLRAVCESYDAYIRDQKFLKAEGQAA